MKSKRVIICAVLVGLLMTLLRSVSSQETESPQRRATTVTREYLPPVRLPVDGPISFEELPSHTRLTDQYNEARGITFNDVTISDYPQGFAHSGTKAIERCWGVEFGCDPRLVMTFTLKPQRRVKVWFGYNERIAQADEVVLKIFNASGASVGETTAPLALSAAPVSVLKELEVISEHNDVVTAIVSLRANAVSFAGLVFDDIEFDDVLPEPDLTIENSQAQIGPGQKLLITALVKNIGQGASSATNLEISEPKFWQTPPTADVPALKPGETAVVSVETSIDRKLQPGAYSYLLIIDAQGLIPEADRNNNSKEDRFLISRGNPDLSVRILQSGVNSDQAFVNAEITNIGTTDSAATVARIESDGQGIGTASVKPLQPQESVEVRILVANKLPSGQHPFQVVIDPDQNLNDNDRSNNKASGLLVVSVIWWKRPDIIIGAGAGLVLILVTVTIYKLVRRKRSLSNKQESVPPGPTVPTFVARPNLDQGRQAFELLMPEGSGFALKLHPHLGASSTQISDGITPPKKGQP